MLGAHTCLRNIFSNVFHENQKHYLHLVHEVTSPQAFHMLKEKGIKVKYPSRTFAVADHIVPTKNRDKPFVLEGSYFNLQVTRNHLE